MPLPPMAIAAVILHLSLEHYSRLVAKGESVIKYKYPLNVVTDTYDHSCCLACADEYLHLITDSPSTTSASDTSSSTSTPSARVTLTSYTWRPGRNRSSQPGGSRGPAGTQNTPYARWGGA
jgi:hypothetical protein